MEPENFVATLLPATHSVKPPAEIEKVYKGRASRVMRRGFFVELDGFGGAEGKNARDVVKRDQMVYVKVINDAIDGVGIAEDEEEEEDMSLEELAGVLADMRIMACKKDSPSQRV